ncbi:MAG: DNA mismatch repair endonuclease MutL [Candidatus Cloacimonadia bacterium]
MNRIKVLAEEVTNQIAAGEIIERPVSIVKELVENAIDAESTRITVVLENGGKGKIQIIDNGIGMSYDDALLAFERHATSKIRNVDDIISISSLGFRGEAIPSIASVSKMELIAKDEESDVATKVSITYGKIGDVSKVSSNRGVDITITQLFGNLPARKKFLKSDQVELKHILDYIYYQALTFPNIHFKLIHNGRERINFPAVEDPEIRLTAVLGKDFPHNDFIKVSAASGPISIEGYIGGLEENRAGFSEFRYTFVNNRFIKDRIINHSLRTAYDPYIKKQRIYQQGKIPPYILFININPELIDFNVHPAKLEIRFRDAHLVHSFIKSTLNDALLAYQEEKYRITEERQVSHTPTDIPISFENYPTFSSQPKKSFKQQHREVLPILDMLYKRDTPQKEAEETTSPVKPIETGESMLAQELYLPSEEELVNPWQIHDSYVLVQSDDGLIIIDQHAAHERIVYEKILHRLGGVPAESQKMLFPIIVDIPPILRNTVTTLIDENPEIFSMAGFAVKSFSGDSVVIDEIPAELGNWDGGEVFKEILIQLQDEYKETEDFRDSMAKAVSCKAAVKAGEKLSRKEMLQLINDLFACEVPYFCPHGRPVIIKFTLTDLERRFKRI